MSRPLRWLALAIALRAAAVAAQTHPAPDPRADVPDVPPGPAAIRGRIVHPADPRKASGLDVVLYSLSASGEAGLRPARSEADGAFAFEDIANDPRTVYLVGARFEDVPFGARVTFAQGELERRIELEIADVVADTAAARAGESRIRIERGCAGLLVSESHELRNPTGRVLYVPEAERPQRAPVLRGRLPEGADHLQTPPPGFRDSVTWEPNAPNALTFWGPVYPGSQEFEFSYTLPAARAKPFRRGFPSGSGPLRIVTPDGRTREAGPVAAGDTLELDLELPSDGTRPEALSFTQARLWLELDDAALVVDEEYQLEVASDGGLESRSGAPLLCVALPPRSEGLRFAPETLSLGLAPDASGALALYGPLPAGPSTLALRYRIPVGAELVRFERRFPRALPLLSVFIADTGVLVESQRLHRLRPVRTADRTYLHLEGFEIAAEEPVEARLSPLPPRRSLSKAGVAGFVLAAALVAVGLLAAPLRTSGPGVARPAPSEAAVPEREALYTAIRDLDEDFELGKLSRDDYDVLRGELRARAVHLLALEQAARAQHASAAVAGPDRCPSCHAAVRAQDRFCSQCGAQLA